MNKINSLKRKNNFKYFILITIMPILGVVVIFTYAFLQVQKDLKFITEEITGLETIKEIQNSVFNIQKLRGLACIQTPTADSTKELELIKEKVSKNFMLLQQKIGAQNERTPLKAELLGFIDSIEKDFLKTAGFNYLSEIIEELMNYSSKISYECNLVLDSELNSYVMVDNVLYLLPQLIEYSGQIRAIATSTKDRKLTKQQKEYFAIQLNKIKENLKKLEFNLAILYKTEQNIDMREPHLKMKKAQSNIIEFTEKHLLNINSVPPDPNKIFELTTKNINSIIALYDINIALLEKSLDNRLKEANKLSIYVILTGLIAILFIIYINGIFYRKNRSFIEEIHRMTITDSMTSLYNRRYFDEVFGSNLKIQSRTKQPLAFIILDIDFFKQYNDTYGHHEGDNVIKIVAEKLKESLKRAGDMAFRLGGEEFGILCIGINHAEALSFSNTIKENIEDEKIEHEKNRASRYLTVSMGVIIIEPNLLFTTNEIYKFADEALYEAKQKGRNQVVVYKHKS